MIPRYYKNYEEAVEKDREKDWEDFCNVDDEEEQEDEMDEFDRLYDEWKDEQSRR